MKRVSTPQAIDSGYSTDASSSEVEYNKTSTAHRNKGDAKQDPKWLSIGDDKSRVNMRGPSTAYGHPLTPQDKLLVEELRNRLKDEIPARYDTDFNLYRWLISADRTSKTRTSLLEMAEKNLRNHFRYRNALRLDTEPVPSWEENPINQDRILPKGAITGSDKDGRLLWVCEYRSIHMEGLMQKYRSSEMLVYHFWLYDAVLRMVNEREARTGLLSGIRLIVDMDGYNMNPFSMLFVSNGSMGYYTHLFHYDHYPELVSQVDICNAAKWMAIPYRVVKAIMPHGFTERFRVHDDRFLDSLLKEVTTENVPDFLGGSNPNMRSVPARLIPPEEYWKSSSEAEQPLTDCHSFSIGPRRRKLVPIEVSRPNSRLSWFFTTDAEILFGLFLHQEYYGRKQSLSSDIYANSEEEENKKDIDKMTMVEPWFRLAGRIVPEAGSTICERPGLYYLVFCNKNAWLSRRNVRLRLEIETKLDRQLLERTFSV